MMCESDLAQQPLVFQVDEKPTKHSELIPLLTYPNLSTSCMGQNNFIDNVNYLSLYTVEKTSVFKYRSTCPDQVITAPYLRVWEKTNEARGWLVS